MNDDDKTRILGGGCDDESPTRVLSGPGAALDDEDAERTRLLSQAPDVERTRVLSPPPGAIRKPAVVVAPPGKPGDRIIFHCPNGHRIVVGRQFAGKRGKCNKCGADVQIPGPSGKASGGVTIGPPPDEDTESEGPEPSPSGSDQAPSLDELAFDGLAAKAAPALDDLGDLGIAGADEAPAQDETVDWNFEAAAAPSPAGTHGWSSPELVPSFDAEDGNPTARLVAKLWSEREHGGVVELHLEGGAVLLPEWYESKWSKGTHGLFASQAPDGSVTLTAVAWESVQKVVVRQLAAVPDDMFT